VGTLIAASHHLVRRRSLSPAYFGRVFCILPAFVIHREYPRIACGEPGHPAYGNSSHLTNSGIPRLADVATVFARRQSQYRISYATLTFSKLRSSIGSRDDHMTTNSPANTTGTHARRLLRVLAEEGKLVFSTREAREAAVRAGIPGGYLYELLHHMTQSDLLTRLRRGLYSTSEVGSGRPQAHPFAIATHLVRPSAISHWSALSHYGLTDQVPRLVTAFTPKRVVTPSMRSPDPNSSAHHAWKIAGVAYEYVSVKKDHFFGIEQVWLDEHSRVPIADRERTVLETFISPRRFGGIGVALLLIESHARQLWLDRLVEYALRYGKISVAKRLGWALESARVDESVLAPLRSMPATRYYALDPAKPSRGRCDKQWMIQDNLQSRGD